MDHIFNKKIETLSRNKIKEIQIKRLKETVHLVYDKVPFYKKKFKELKIKPDDIKTLEDINKLPFTTKNDLRACASFHQLPDFSLELIRFDLGKYLSL